MTRRSKVFLGRLRRTCPRFGLIFAASLLLSIFLFEYPYVDGWPYYRDGWEILTTVAHLAIVAVAAGSLVGVFVGLITVMLSLVCDRRWQILGRAQSAIIFLLALIVGTLFARNILLWLMLANTWRGSSTIGIAFSLTCTALVGGYLFRRCRPHNAPTTLNGLFTSSITRRSVMTIGGSAAAVTMVRAGELAVLRLNQPKPLPEADNRRNRRPNILLITFDALNAEDMSSYGYHLPTTPNIDRFAKNATTFRQFYSCSTFTTPSVVAFTCGRYPSSTRVYHLCGALQADEQTRTLPFMLRQAGYATGASVANLHAHPAICQIGGYDFAPRPPVDDPIIQSSFGLGLSDISVDLLPLSSFLQHQRLTLSTFLTDKSHFTRRAPPHASFDQATTLWRGLPGPKFLHVHVWAPHMPYLPGKEFRGRFCGTLAPIEYEDDKKLVTLLTTNGTYALKNQVVFNEMRLRYDEWICDADSAFGAFLDQLEAAGDLDNTIVAVSADHGESFEGGIFSHGGGSQIRSIVHVPLILRVPGQNVHKDISYCTDASNLAPTLLDAAGQPVPHWMDGFSLLPMMNAPRNVPEGYAFTQYFERNSAFAPITRGTIGCIDGSHQYIVDVQSGAGRLYELANAHLQSQEISAKRPDITRALRERIRARFPDIAIPA